MLVVRLSRMALRIKVRNASRHNRVCLLLVRKGSRTKLNPPFWSTTSTIAIAPIRKKIVVAVSPKWCSIRSLTCDIRSPGATPGRYCPGSSVKMVQHTTNINKAIAALLTRVKLSSVMAM